MNIKERFENISWKKTEHLAPVVLFLLILALCWKLASIFWWVVAPPQVMQPEQVSLGSQQIQVPNISSFSLFEEVGSSATADDSIPMVLQGVVVSYPARFSSAVIKVKETADRYAVGDPIEGTSYQLSEVYWDHIVLSQNGNNSKELRFTGLDSLYQPMPGQSTDQNTSPPVSNPVPSPQQNSSQNALGQAIERMNENRDEYLKNMGVNASGGQGYEVTDQTPAALRNKLGLRSGDRILSLNGQSVGQGQSDVQLLEQAKRDGKVKIEIKRGDQVMTIQQSL
ncbi:MAG: PDZ domain-containing protein [Acinetobacter sp.]|uniref:type II secretion system protein N n=1 Tax=Acinetobacter guillouiae TaxID=106649 RepID=UPI00265489C5|nr:PDZ domain-containing protein [Acinetobacter sp.]MDN5432586.1 PDZ domain-containing protein [Acinetobacter sp.]MDN5623152.1 PDZ domain-containing protein [Acinetobacter sp.]MDN5650158.1 PDZ domain-containing protein [Acinetobacter sp.]MDN5690934.1 PDZ domain-containing protein [Acinetobacter sp.]